MVLYTRQVFVFDTQCQREDTHITSDQKCRRSKKRNRILQNRACVRQLADGLVVEATDTSGTLDGLVVCIVLGVYCVGVSCHT